MINRKLGNRYEILDRVGGGGTAIVYKAIDVLLDRIVAVKILRSQYIHDDHFVKRFRREAQSAARLSHPNIVSVYDVGEEQDTHFIVMEYMEGSTLKDYIISHGPLPVDKVVDLTKQVAQALDHAHKNDIIHRDIKPQNILLSKNGVAKVTDFGIARAVSSATITHTNSVMGSVHYFSPEQARGGLTGEKSDIYSLGIVMYEMITGALPFSGESPISVALKHLQDDFEEPRHLNENIPQSVENVILRSLAKDVNQRYDSASEMIHDLETCLHPQRLWEPKLVLEDWDDNESTKIMPVVNQAMYDSKNEKSRSRGMNAANTGEKNKKKRPMWLKVSIIALILLLLALGIFLLVKFILSLFYVEEVEVKDVTGLPVDVAVDILEEQNLEVDSDYMERHSDEIEAGHVLRHNPTGGSTVRVNTMVQFTVSLGKEQVSMTRVANLPQQTALSLLRQLHIPDDNITIEEEYSDQIQAGYVISQTPEENELIIPDETEVTLVISQGFETVEVPDLIGRTEDEARSQLDRAELIMGRIERDYSDLPEGQVFQQDPESGQEININSNVNIWVSEGREFQEVTREVTVEVPDNQGPDRGNNRNNNEVRATIIVIDTEGQNTVVDEDITSTKTYSINLIVSRNISGTINVYRDDEEYRQIEVHYN